MWNEQAFRAATERPQGSGQRGLVAVLGLLAGGAQAQEIGFAGEAATGSEYVSFSSGRPALRLSGTAFDPQGFHAGAWASTVRFTDFVPGDPDRPELAMFVGWERGLDSGFALDLGHEHCFHDDSCCCCGIAYLGASQFVGPQVQLAGRLEYNPRARLYGPSTTGSFFPGDSAGLRLAF